MAWNNSSGICNYYFFKVIKIFKIIFNWLYNFCGASWLSNKNPVSLSRFQILLHFMYVLENYLFDFATILLSGIHLAVFNINTWFNFKHTTNKGWCCWASSTSMKIFKCIHNKACSYIWLKWFDSVNNLFCFHPLLCHNCCFHN